MFPFEHNPLYSPRMNTPPLSTWSRDELESAFRSYQDQVVQVATSGEWARFADLFVEDTIAKAERAKAKQTSADQGEGN